MKERPILFSASMVRALLDGSKTQTRRVVKPQPAGEIQRGESGFNHWIDSKYWERKNQKENRGIGTHGFPCPYGQPGDRLWVKEEHYLFGIWRIDGKRANGKPKYRFEADQGMGAQFDEWPNGLITGGRNTEVPGWYKRIGMFMPRWASRSLDEIVSVRVERLQDISEPDAIAEGIEPLYGAWRHYQTKPSINHHPAWSTAIGSYRSLWESINGTDSWAANPCVWVIEFKRIAP
ncbi:MAG: hypothetical protein Q8R67_21670 [Rhodoferax sp.]|nr:hypothetical protein [Rhodoferax sp.]MDP3654285.1 hypothetical protein [Rhodoferax sp.]